MYNVGTKEREVIIMSSAYVNEYIQSTEEYKGFVLEIRCYRFSSSKSLAYHRDCRLYKDGVAIARAKTKKELKDLIDHGCY